MSWFKDFWKWPGVKRRIAAFLTSLSAVIAQRPEFVPLLPLVDWLAAIFGVTGLTHAGVNDKLWRFKPANLASLLAILVAICDQVPQLQPWAPLARLIAGWFGAYAFGHGMVEARKSSTQVQQEDFLR